ncbi:hypothetical protein MCOR27_006766 [Pyricularia oryzae]|uniref:RelA/SpoT domain-containing protein n=2 Tax=Pyricularia TaxID=48558 RepID=A0ABQ8NQY6_PYRGI|nr:hypothetical protein MCOR01_010779 [Pyricularia oryzae]KAI6300810.1 hypothetical protein MCOR33_003555 [Pyricularia grisea]KAI6263680.1 hypothetical protein MCOR19_000013 [Pyricularia oryzae]KAI6275815.1 hypothetical protein MCOR27_006766 [Pyricularia oryzae]KAI6281091.1 hypothetical protein MCOR26_003456 [Pyricularia oryzae]
MGLHLVESVMEKQPLSEKILALSLEWDTKDNVGDFFVDRLWPQLESDYQDMLVEAKRYLLDQLGKDRNVSGVASFVQARVKTTESIRRSVQRRSKSHDIVSPADIFFHVHDLVGLKVIVDVRGNVLKMNDFVADCFQRVQGKDMVRHELLRHDSTDEVSEFGAYEAYNHHIHLPDDYKVSRFTNVIFEIQVTTIGEALFNILDHDMNYKGGAGPLSDEQRAWLDNLKSATKQIGLSMAHLTDKTHQGSKLEQIYQLLCKTANDVKGKPRSDLLCSLSDELQSLVPDGHGIKEKRRKKLVQSFKFPDLNKRRNMIVETCPETYQWIFERDDQINAQAATVGHVESPPWPSFSDWVKSEPCFFWISGKPGSGKSTLINFILQDPRTKELLDQWKPGAVIISHFFWKAGSALETSLMGMLCSLVHQLADENTYVQHLIMARVSKWKKKQNPSDWHQGELSSLLDTILTKFPCPIFVLIDGLDEVSDKRDRLDLIQTLNRFRGLRNVKVCVSSRPEPFFQESFRNEQHLRLQDLTKGDMQKEASAILEDWSDKYGKKEVTDLGEALVQKAEGVFLWLHLAGLRLKEGFHRGDTMNELEQCLEALPVELNRLYEEMWLRVNEDKKSKQVAAHYVNILVQLNHVKHRGSLPNLLVAAIATFPGRQMLIDRSKADVDLTTFTAHHKEVQRSLTHRCAGIFQVTDQGSEVNPIHRSVFDFFVDTEEGLKIRDSDSCPHDQTVTNILEGLFALQRFTSFADCVKVNTAICIIRRHTQISKDLLRTYAHLIKPWGPRKPGHCAHILSWLLVEWRQAREQPRSHDEMQRDHHHVQQCVEKFIQQCRRPKALASWILRETTGRQHKDMRDMLLGQGADMWERGVAGDRSWLWWGHKFSRDVVTYASAGALALLDIWKNGLPVDSGPLSLTAENFDPGECVPLRFRSTESWDGGTLPKDSVNYCVNITLKANLALLIEILKPLDVLSGSFLFRTSSVPPSVSLLLVEYEPLQIDTRARALLAPSDENLSDLIAHEIMHALALSNRYGDWVELQSGSVPETHKLVHGFLQNPNDSFKFVNEPAKNFLARHDCGYRMVKDLEPWELDELDMCLEGEH